MKILNLVFIMAAFFQGCGPNDDTGYPTACYQPINTFSGGPSQSLAIGPVISINGSWAYEQYYTKTRQKLELGVSEINQESLGGCGDGYYFPMEPCGLSPKGSYWLLHDGSKVENYCATIFFKKPGTYKIFWVYTFNLKKISRPLQIIVQDLGQ